MTPSPKPWERNWDAVPAGAKPWERDWNAPAAAAPGLGQQIVDSGVNFLKDVGSAGYGAAATANRIFANLADIGENVVKNTAGIEAAAPLRDWGQTFRANQQAQQAEAQRLAGGRKDFAGQLTRGLTQGVLELPQYAVAAHVAGPVGGMAAIGAITEADQGWQAALQAAAEGALTGGALHVMGPASQAVRLTGAAAMTYAQARLQGADNETALAHATTMGLMAGHAPGGVTAREFVPGLDTAIKTGERAAEATGAGARAAGPDVGMGAAKAAGGYAAGELASMVPGGGFVKHVFDIPTALVGGRQIGRGLKKGYQAARTSWAETAPPEAPSSAPATPGPAGVPTDDAILHLYSVETDPAKRAALQAELVNRGLVNDPNAPPAPEENPYRGYTQTALRNVYQLEPDPAKRALIEQAAKARGLSLLNQEGRRATAAPPETGAPESRGPSMTQDDVLLLRFLGEENPEAADAETIGIARQLAAERPDLLQRLRSGAPEPPVAPVTPQEAAAPAVQSLGTLEYTAPGAAPAPVQTPATPPEPPPAGPPETAAPVDPAPAAGKGNAAEIAQQLEASTRPDRMLDFLRRMDPEITPDALDSIAPHEWAMVAEGAGSPRGTAPTAEDIATIRENLGGIKAQEPAAAAAEFETKRQARTRRKPAPAPVAEPDLEGQLAGSLAAVEAGQRPVAEAPPEGPAKATASQTRVETIAQHMAGIPDFNLDYLNDIAEDPEALGVLDKLGRQLKVRGPQSPAEVQQIVDRVRQLREDQGPTAAPAAPGGVPPAGPPSRAQTFVDRVAERVAQFAADEEGASPSRRGTPMSLAELMGQSEPVPGGEQAPRTLKLKASGKGGSLLTSDLGQALEKSMDKRYRLDQDTSVERRKSRAVESMMSDLRYALAQDDNGRGWYTEDVATMEKLLKEARPEFNNPHTMSLFKYLLGITSNGVDPELNFDAALRGWDLYKNNGKFSAYDPDRPSDYGNPEGTGLTFRANSYRGAMRRLNQLVIDKGEAGAVEWLKTKHPVSELKQYYDKVPVGDNEPRYGSYIFGEKVGSFGSNLNGIHTELTADKWWSRTWNRWMGTMMDTDQAGNVRLNKETGEPLLQDDPRNEGERNLMRETATKVAGDLGLEVDELQAVLWYTEQQLYRNYGIAAQSASYADAAKKRLGKVLRSENGVDRGTSETRGPDANPGKTGRGSAKVSERVPLERPEGSRKEVAARRKTLKDLMQPQ